MTLIGRTTSGKDVHDTKAEEYTRRSKVPKWNTDVSVLTLGAPTNLTRSRFPGWSHKDHMEAAKMHAMWRDDLEREHRMILDEAEKKYGTPPSYISGGVSDIFPEKINDKLRSLAHESTHASDASKAHYAASGARKPYPFGRVYT